MSHKEVGRSSISNAGVSVRRTSFTGAKAEMMSETGATTLLFPSPSRHTVFIDSESLPTGIAMPNAGHNSLPTAWTVS